MGFVPPIGVGFVPPNSTGSVHRGISVGPHAGHMHFTNNQQQPLHHEEAQIPPVRRTVVTPAPHLVDNQEDLFSMQDAMELPVEAERKFQLFEECTQVDKSLLLKEPNTTFHCSQSSGHSRRRRPGGFIWL